MNKDWFYLIALILLGLGIALVYQSVNNLTTQIEQIPGNVGNFVSDGVSSLWNALLSPFTGGTSNANSIGTQQAMGGS